MATREAIVAAARGFLGTPYHHQASCIGVGTDCLGLIRGVWRELYGPEPEAMPAYTRDWGNATGSEMLLEVGCRHLKRLDAADAAQPGDVLVFRMRDAGVAKHAGILVEPELQNALRGSRPGRHPEARAERASKDGRAPHHDVLRGLHLVHSQEDLGVVEIALSRWWRRRIVAAFSFPGVV
jgi:NlpC/P60 family putative phage cell wall peptidase